MQNQPTIAFIGAGNMASAIIGGLIKNGYNSDSITAADPYQPSLDKLSQSFNVKTSSDNNQAIADADIIVLAIKPQQMASVCKAIAQNPALQNALIISIAAGITCKLLESCMNTDIAIIRCMPNTPALISEGATGAFANANVKSEQKEQAQQLLNAIGITQWVDEEHLLDAVTAVSGSGPAYFFLMIEAMQAAGTKLGLDAQTAKALSIQTALGAAKMVQQSELEPATLRENVTSPNGTTEAALKVFAQMDFNNIVEQALNAADARSKSLAAQMLEEL